MSFRVLFIAYDKETFRFLGFNKKKRKYYWEKIDYRAFAFRSERRALKKAVKHLGTHDAEQRIVAVDT